jgi:hypothetical protein
VDAGSRADRSAHRSGLELHRGSQRGRSDVLAQLERGQQHGRQRRDRVIAVVLADALEGRSGQQCGVRCGGSRFSGPVPVVACAEEDLADVQSARRGEEVRVLFVEGEQLALARLDLLGVVDDRLDHRRGEVGPNAPVDIDQPELDRALDQQLLVDHAIEHVAPQLRVDGLAPVALEAGDQTFVVLEPDERIADARDRAVGQVAGIRALADHADRGGEQAECCTRCEPRLRRPARLGCVLVVGHGSPVPPVLPRPFERGAAIVSRPWPTKRDRSTPMRSARPPARSSRPLAVP